MAITMAVTSNFTYWQV